MYIYIYTYVYVYGRLEKMSSKDTHNRAPNYGNSHILGALGYERSLYEQPKSRSGLARLEGEEANQTAEVELEEGLDVLA